MWFTEFYGGQLGRLARDGRITKFALRGESVYPADIVSRSDGYLFIAMPRGGVIASTYLAASEPTRTATATATRTPTVPPGSTATATSPPNATPTAPRGGCAGDCDGSGDVSISEIIAAVNVALGNADSSTCPNADADRSGEVLINDLIAAVSAALSGCPE